MRSVSAAFTQISTVNKHRTPSYQIGVADSVLTLPTEPFIACESIACGDNIIDCGGEANWTSYLYGDKSADADRWEITSEFSGEDELLGSIITTTAEVTFRNTRSEYSPIIKGQTAGGELYLPAANGASTIDKPFRLRAGFRNDGTGYTEDVNIFYGESVQLPEISSGVGREKARFHLTDYVNRLLNLELKNDIILTDVSIDEILVAVFQDVGLASTYLFDEGEYTMPVFYARAGAKLSEFIPDLVDSNLGTLRMNETFGIFEYWNQSRLDDQVTAITLDNDIIKEFTYIEPKPAISEVRVKWRERDYMRLRQFYTSPLIFAIDNGETRSHEFTFENPADSVTAPVASSALATPATGSYFNFNLEADGSGLEETLGFTTSITQVNERKYVVSITNTSGQDGYITRIVLSGREFGIVAEGEINLNNNTSDSTPRKADVDLYHVNSSDQATDVAERILKRYGRLANPEAFVEIKGLPQLEVGDKVVTKRHESNTVPSTTGTYQSQDIREEWIIRKSTMWSDESGLSQRLTLIRDSSVIACFIACESLACSDAVICC